MKDKDKEMRRRTIIRAYTIYRDNVIYSDYHLLFFWNDYFIYKEALGKQDSIKYGKLLQPMASIKFVGAELDKEEAQKIKELYTRASFVYGDEDRKSIILLSNDKRMMYSVDQKDIKKIAEGEDTIIGEAKNKDLGYEK